MFAIFKREFISYFKSPVGYIALAIFSFLAGFSYSAKFSKAYIDMPSIIMSLCSFFIILIPIVTMGLLSEDKRRGTDVIYYTSPIKLVYVVFGKFLAAVALFGVLYLIVIVLMIVTKFYGGVINVSVLSASLIFFCLVFLYVSIGIFASSFSESQIISAIVSFVFILLIQLLPTIGSFVSSAVMSVMGLFGNPSTNTLYKVSDSIVNAFSWLDPMQRFNTTNLGILNIISIFYCLSLTFFFLFLTYRMLEKKRWSQA